MQGRIFINGNENCLEFQTGTNVKNGATVTNSVRILMAASAAPVHQVTHYGKGKLAWEPRKSLYKFILSIISISIGWTGRGLKQR